MNISEILKAKGISDETIAAVLDEMKQNKIFTASEENLDIRYGKLKTQHEGTAKQLDEANALIEELKKNNTGNEALQQQVTAYEQQVKTLQAELEEAKITAEAKVGLLEANVVDVDYMLFKLREKAKADGKTIELDDNGHIKGWDDMLSGLQTMAPNMFKTQDGNDDGYQILKPNRLKGGDGGEPQVTRDSFRAMSYEERLALKQKNEQLYNTLSR